MTSARRGREGVPKKEMKSDEGGRGGLANLDIIFKMEYQLTILELYMI